VRADEPSRDTRAGPRGIKINNRGGVGPTPDHNPCTSLRLIDSRAANTMRRRRVFNVTTEY
jgi:hypothetical protein